MFPIHHIQAATDAAKTQNKSLMSTTQQKDLATELKEEIAAVIIPHSELRKKFLIDVKQDLQPPQMALSLVNPATGNEAVFGLLGDFGVVIGKAKSRKSFLVNLAVAGALSQTTIPSPFKGHLPKNQNSVIIFDTEQSKYYVQKAVKRICKQINQPEPKNLQVFHLRSLSTKERLDFIEAELYDSNNKTVGFVIIDGIRDLITSINDEAEASMITNKLLKWSEELNIFILVVIHQNKGDNNARGHAGAELTNKAFMVASVTKSEGNADISVVEAEYCRDKDFETFAFEIDENGIPVIAQDFAVRTETKKNKFDILDLEDHKKYSLLTTVYSNGESFSFAELSKQLQIAYKHHFKKTIGLNAVGRLITESRNNDWILQEKPKSPYILGSYDK